MGCDFDPTGSHGRDFDSRPRLSDHLPIVAHFRRELTEIVAGPTL